MPKGGSRPGAGRPKGRKNQATLARDAAQAYLSERIRQELDPLIDAHLVKAKGLTYMFGKVNDTWQRVTDPATMLLCLQSGEAFYRITSEDPDAKAIKDILDREFGRAKEQIEHSGPDGGPVAVRFVDA